MSTQAVSYQSASKSPATISDLQQIIESALEGLRPAPLSENITAAFPYLLPRGLRLRVQLEEDGRKKRSTAAASNWNPETGEIVIYFERQEPESSIPPAAIQPTAPAAPNGDSAIGQEFYARMKRQEKLGLQADPLNIPSAERHAATSLLIQTELARPQVLESEIQQLCAALADAEKAGKSFISLKWFRDNDLTGRGYTWADSIGYRQAVLTKAIEVGAVLTTSIPNPKAPQHPTTTVRLNRESKYAQEVAPRFQPIRAKGGASASEIILRDRGRF
jgi:hypothetical protein